MVPPNLWKVKSLYKVKNTIYSEVIWPALSHTILESPLQQLDADGALPPLAPPAVIQMLLAVAQVPLETPSKRKHASKITVDSIF
jgi:hypothetical protein